jgi:hypothetical protein
VSLARGDVLLTGLVEFFTQASHESRKDDLTKLAGALQAYHRQHGHLPPPAVYAADGRPLLSWRVLLLPQLGEEELFKQFHLDEPWDGEHNRSLLENMPDVYESGNPVRISHCTFYQAVVGPGTLFEGRQGVLLESIRDGASQTVLLAEGREPVPWTKPQELAFTPDGPLPYLGGSLPDGFYVLFADGQPRFLRRTVEERTLRALFTRAGGEKVDVNKLP